MNLIVAVSENWGIGKDNNLLFHLPKDLAYFKQKTLEKVVIMGDRTYDSLPKRPLPKRVNFVMTLNKSYKADGAIVVHSEKELFQKLKNFNTQDVFVCGGASIYRLLLNFCEKAYITKIQKQAEADTFFPNLDQMKNWKLLHKGETLKENGLEFSFDEYVNLDVKTF